MGNALSDTATLAIIIVCVTIGVSVIALIIFVILFCRVNLKDDNNVRKRIITKNAFEDIKEERPPTPPPQPQPKPAPIVQPLPPAPVILPPPPPPQPVIIPRPVRLPPPPRPVEPRVIVREVIREREPDSPLPIRREMHRRRKSWTGAGDDLILVKKVKKQSRAVRNRGYVSQSSSSGSSSSSSSDDEDTIVKRPQMGMVPVAVGMQRLQPYDLASPPVAAPRRMMMMAPVAAAAAAPAGPGFVSVMMPRM